VAAKSAEYEYYVLAGFLTGTAFPQIWDNAASSAYTATWVALHTGDPTASGHQGTNELSPATYTGYARVSVARSTAGWAVSTSAGGASPVAAISFPQITSTSTAVASYFSVGLTSASTDGIIGYSGTITPNINIGLNVTARLTTGSSITES
jgi:hypothetical protein